MHLLSGFQGDNGATYELISLDSGEVVATLGKEVALISPRSDAWLEVVDANGNVVDLLEPSGDFERVEQLTVLDDGTVVATGNLTDGRGVYIELLELGPIFL